MASIVRQLRPAQRKFELDVKLKEADLPMDAQFKTGTAVREWVQSGTDVDAAVAEVREASASFVRRRTLERAFDTAGYAAIGLEVDMVPACVAYIAENKGKPASAMAAAAEVHGRFQEVCDAVTAAGGPKIDSLLATWHEYVLSNSGSAADVVASVQQRHARAFSASERLTSAGVQLPPRL